MIQDTREQQPKFVIFSETEIQHEHGGMHNRDHLKRLVENHGGIQSPSFHLQSSVYLCKWNLPQVQYNLSNVFNYYTP